MQATPGTGRQAMSASGRSGEKSKRRCACGRLRVRATRAKGFGTDAESLSSTPLYVSPHRRMRREEDLEMKILIVEDDPKTGTYLCGGLAESGFVVDIAENGVDGFHFATTGDYDLLILDVMLPQWDGWSLLEKLRGAGKQTPVLFLTGRDTVADRVKGLELGADDYLVKPFTFSELRARVRALLRRGPSRQPEKVEIGDLMLDMVQRKVTRGGQRIDLTAKEFKLLELLARHTGEILPRAVIAEQVWDMNFDSDTNVVDVAIRRLRGKIDDPFGIKLIHCVRGMGYVCELR
jgi:two-component system copper resistance phosphate regulon response regulator CusR